MRASVIVHCFKKLLYLHDAHPIVKFFSSSNGLRTSRHSPNKDRYNALSGVVGFFSFVYHSIFFGELESYRYKRDCNFANSAFVPGIPTFEMLKSGS
ncbi:hypothetical protein BDZ45DRAFT_86493 [Acephala macrosclerotiorum]|nr:hypothetical protein BDZ45DRAFT_86493 [Acephala macrosclerotiorum]